MSSDSRAGGAGRSLFGVKLSLFLEDAEKAKNGTGCEFDRTGRWTEGDDQGKHDQQGVCWGRQQNWSENDDVSAFPNVHIIFDSSFGVSLAVAYLAGS
jgi:hypothetical protein